MAAALLDFWQQYEKAMELDGQTFRVWLWPVEGVWPRPGHGINQYSDGMEKLFAPKDRYFLPGGVHKGHIFALDFGGAAPETAAADLAAPLFPWCEPARYAETRALPFLFGPPGLKSGNRECDFRLATWERMSRAACDPAGDTGIWAARKKSMDFVIGYKSDYLIWYGWMDFGDICVPGTGTISLGRDWPLLVLSDYLRTGNPHSLKLASEMVRHLTDIDQFWSDRDLPHVSRLRSGVVWPTFHAGNRSAAVSTAPHISGLALWYMLTGEPKARDAALRSAEGLVAFWEHVNTRKDRIRGDMAANGAAIQSFCVAYDLTADRKWLDRALELFNTSVVEKYKKFGPHLHSPGRGQLDGQDIRGEDQAYLSIIGPLCLLHSRTGDSGVLKLLTEATEKPLSEDSHFDAPASVAGLYAYAGAVTGNAAFRKLGIDTFNQGYPVTKSPQVFLHENSTWHDDAARKLYAGQNMAYAIWLWQQSGRK
ncbi:MAG: hypothetical protein N3A38_04545 [Planctomycetota bacterium]|nr:hypothetical protein [Planctomycetota bacterium]